MMDYIAFCRNWFAATRIPADLLLDGRPVYSSLGDTVNYAPSLLYELFPMTHNPSFCTMNSDIDYGRIHIDDTAYDIILGPVFTVPVTDELVRVYMNELMLPLSLRQQVEDVLYAIPVISHNQLGQNMALVYQCVNGKEADPAALYDDGQTGFSHEAQQLERMDRLESGDIHNTYLFEIGMYECIKSGQTERLRSYFEQKAMNLYEGSLAASPLRHAKNLLIESASKCAVIGAIPGGMDVDKAYQLTEYYIRECERLTSIEAVGSLMYSMIFDFCQRTGESKIPPGISSDTSTCMNFIRSHVNQPLSVGDVAAHIHRSESYIMKKFQSELGIHVGAFIMRCRLEEARSMLIYTEKSLAEISTYLCFSSQSYFQNVFKKQYGLTPMQFRRSGRRIS